MGNTPRAINRILLGILGLTLLTAGLGLIAITANEPIKHSWNSAMTSGQQAAHQAFEKLAAPWGFSWITLGTLVFLILVMILMIQWILAQYANRSKTLKGQGSSLIEHRPEGKTSFSTEFARQALSKSIKDNPEVLSLTVNNLVLPKKSSGLHHKIEARQGSNQAKLQESIDQSIAGLDALLGQQVPITVAITGGIRARITEDSARVD